MNSGSCKKLKRSKPPLVAKVSLCGDPHAGHPVTSFGGPQSLHQYRRQDATARPMESLDLVLDDRGAVLVRGCIQRRLEIHLLHIEKPADRNPAWPSASHGIHGSLMSLIDSQMPHIRQEHAPNYFETHAAAADQIAVTPGSTPPRKQRCGNAGAIAAGFLVHAEEPIPGLCPPEATDSDCATDLATFSQLLLASVESSAFSASKEGNPRRFRAKCPSP